MRIAPVRDRRTNSRCTASTGPSYGRRWRFYNLSDGAFRLAILLGGAIRLWARSALGNDSQERQAHGPAETAIVERKELREMAMRTYPQVRSKEGKEQSLAIERIFGSLLTSPWPMLAQQWPRKSWAGTKTVFHGLAVALAALVAAFIEVTVG